MNTHANRVAAGAMVLAPVVQMCMDAGAMVAGLEVSLAYALHLPAWAAIIGICGLSLHRSLLALAAACLGLFVVATAWPALTLICLAAACGGMSLLGFVVWGRG